MNKISLKEMGMETEFFDWMKNRKKELRVGDRIRINLLTESDKKKWEDFGVRHGDEGVIEEILTNSFYVNFDRHSYSFHPNNHSWYVRKKDVSRV